MPVSSLTRGRIPVADTVSLTSALPKLVLNPSWNSYLVVPAVGLQEKAGLVLLVVPPFGGDSTSGTCAPSGSMVKSIVMIMKVKPQFL